MPNFLVFTCDGDKLSCTPPNCITDTDQKQIALIDFLPRTHEYLLECNFVYHSDVSDGSRCILGSTSGPVVYLDLKPNLTTLEISLLKPSDLSSITPKDCIALCHIVDK